MTIASSLSLPPPRALIGRIIECHTVGSRLIFLAATVFIFLCKPCGPRGRDQGCACDVFDFRFNLSFSVQHFRQLRAHDGAHAGSQAHFMRIGFGSLVCMRLRRIDDTHTLGRVGSFHFHPSNAAVIGGQEGRFKWHAYFTTAGKCHRVG